MSFLGDIRQRRRKMKKQLKVAQAKAREEAKQAAKRQRKADKEKAKAAEKERRHERRVELKQAAAESKRLERLDAKERKLDAKALKRAEKIRKNGAKDEAKALKAKQRHQQKLAEKILDQQRSQGFSKDKVQSWIGGGRLLLPVLVPFAYRLITGLQRRSQNADAKRFGVTSAAIARHHGYGAPLRARVEATRESLDELNRSGRAGTDGFVRDAKSRLDVIDDALDTAENLTPDQRRHTHRSITAELDALDRQVLAKLGI